MWRSDLRLYPSIKEDPDCVFSRRYISYFTQVDKRAECVPVLALLRNTGFLSHISMNTAQDPGQRIVENGE